MAKHHMSRRKYKKGVKGLALAFRKLKKVDKTLKLIKPEVKYADQFNNLTAVTSTVPFDTYPMSTIAQGDDNYHDRIGNQIKPLMMDLRGSVVMVGTTTSDISTIVRLTVTHWPNASGIVPTTYNTSAAPCVFESPSAPPFFLCPRNIDTKAQCRVVYDKTFTFSDTGNKSHTFRKLIKMSGITRYQGSAAQIPDKGLWIISFVSNEVTATAPLINLSTRITYFDD